MTSSSNLNPRIEVMPAHIQLARLPNDNVAILAGTRTPSGVQAFLASQRNGFGQGTATLPPVSCSSRSESDSIVALDMQVTFHLQRDSVRCHAMM